MLLRSHEIVCRRLSFCWARSKRLPRSLYPLCSPCSLAMTSILQSVCCTSSSNTFGRSPSLSASESASVYTSRLIVLCCRACLFVELEWH